MTIQFACVSCGKPIEVDNDWSMRLVECPYCHDTVRAPGMSTSYAPSVATMSASTLPSPVVFTEEMVGYPGAAKNNLAFVALGLSGLGLVFLVASVVGAIVAMAREIGLDAGEARIQQWVEEASKQPKPWMVAVGAGMIASFACWLGGLITSLMAIFRPGRRGVSIAALIIALFTLMLFLIGTLFGG